MRPGTAGACGPRKLTASHRLRKFMIDLYLSGNGALIFSNAFVEWAASEVLRRARPRTIVARFGMRSKPKPFTSIAIFENQQRVSSLPDVDDPENSAIDAAILARYVWLAAAQVSGAGTYHLPLRLGASGFRLCGSARRQEPGMEPGSSRHAGRALQLAGDAVSFLKTKRNAEHPPPQVPMNNPRSIRLVGQ